MNLAGLILASLAPQARAFEEASKHPMEAQKRVLFEHLHRNQNTEYGRRYNFSKIGSIEEYRKSVPLSNYELIRPFVDRMASGEANVLTSDRVDFFSTTTGTTSKPKLIPETRYSRKKKARLMNLWGYYIAKDHPGILNGKTLAIVSAEIEGRAPSGVPCGAESGHGYKNLSMAIKHIYALPHYIFEISDYESRYYCILRLAVEQNITNIATLNPSTILLLCQKLQTMKERLIDDIEKGRLDPGLDMPKDIRARIEKLLSPNPGRAGELRAILEKKGDLMPKDLWPNLELIECWKGGSVKFYLKQIPEYFGDIPIRDFGCLSSEARSSLAISDFGAGGVLAINTNFYEFIPKEDINKAGAKTLLSDEIEEGREYFIVVTTPGGLYRYNIDDIIKVDGFFNKTPVIEFVQKGLSATSVTGEKLYEEHISEAMARALEKTKIAIESFSACIQWDKTPRYVFLAEFVNNPSRNQKAGLLKHIEEELYKQNIEYKEKRKAQLLGSPILKTVKAGDFQRYRANRVKEGAHDGQFKMPELTGDSDFQKNFSIEEEISI